jgi:hypothetical protein
MPRNPIYKGDGRWKDDGGIDPYVVHDPAELEPVPESTDIQFAVIEGDGGGANFRMRLPGGAWTEV